MTDEDRTPDGEQTERAKRLTQRTKSTRTDVADDDLAPDPPRDGGDGLPGVRGFESIRSVIPFFWLWSAYATHLYPRHKDDRGRHAQFVKDHVWIVRVSFAMDLILRLVLVLIVLEVIIKGIWPLPWVH